MFKNSSYLDEIMLLDKLSVHRAQSYLVIFRINYESDDI